MTESVSSLAVRLAGDGWLQQMIVASGLILLLMLKLLTAARPPADITQCCVVAFNRH